MNKVHNVTRRAAMLGAAVSTAALVVPVASVAMEHSEADLPVNIEQLAEAFRDAAMTFDPRISECWIGYDETTDGPRDMRVMWVHFGRTDAPYVPHPRPGSIADLFREWREVREERTDDPGEADARYARYAALQRKITAMRPNSAREAAMQFVVETDDGESDYRPEFFRGLRLIAMGI